MKNKSIGELTTTPGSSGALASLRLVPHWLRATAKPITIRLLLELRRSERLAVIHLVLWLASTGLVATGCTSATTTTQIATPPTTVIESNATVVRVVDGDTIKVKLSGKSESVRLIGIDTPETVDPHRPVGCYGKEASTFTKQLLPKNTPVRLVLDVEARDRFDRLLAYVYRSTDGLFVNAELAGKGYANTLTIPPNVAHQAEFTRLVSQARETKLGLWSMCESAAEK